MASVTGIDYEPYVDPSDPDNLLTGDLDLTFREVEDDRVLLWDVLKTVTTPRGNLFWAPRATLSLLDELNAVKSKGQEAELAARVEALFADDPRMDVACRIELHNGRLSADIAVLASTSGKAYRAVFEDGALELL